MKVQARCAYRCWVNLTLVNPGEVCEIEHDGPLATMRKGSSWVFEFDRTMAGTGEAPAIGGFICKACGKSFDAVQQLGNHTKSDHQKTGWNPPKVEADPETEPEKPEGSNSAGNMRGVKPLHCKGCGELFPNVHVLAKHKPVCSGAVSKGPAEAAQATPA